MENFFDKSLHYLGQNKKDVFVMNIGAMDGVLFDEMIGYTNMYNFNGLYVEPVPYLFEKLKSNIKFGKFENSAISDYDGKIKMMTIKREVIDSGLVHNCFYGMSAVFPPKNGLGSEFDRPTVEKYGELIDVDCITWNSLLKKHAIDKIDVIKIDAEGHDYQIFKQIDLQKHNLKVIRLEWINLNSKDQQKIIDSFENNNFAYEISGQDIVAISEELHKELLSKFNLESDTSKFELKYDSVSKQPQNKTTFVTGLWNIKRNELDEGWARDYKNHYLAKFGELLKCESNMIIFGDSELENFVFQFRHPSNTHFIKRDLSWFKGDFFHLIQKIRNNPSWLEQATWLPGSTQAKLEFYNPLVMSKMFLLHDAKIMDPFDSEHMFWIDAGLSNTVHPGYFTHDRVQEKLPKYFHKFGFVCFPYKPNTEIHGFSYPKINEYAGDDVGLVARGGFFGGPKESISEVNSIYYQTLMSTLKDGYMGTEESIFSILLYRHRDSFQFYEIEENGLIGKFFEDLKEDRLQKGSLSKNSNPSIDLDTDNCGLYVIGFNSPNQFRTLIRSMLDYDPDFIQKPRKILLNNSTDLKTTPEYEDLCQEHGFSHVKMDNLGICGGRQWIAEDAEEKGFDFYFFFEDDMFFFSKPGETCRNGFNRFVPDLYKKSLEIIKSNGFDFLKLNYSEFFGDNGTQWSWYNVPQSVRDQYFPEKPNLPKIGQDPNAPKTEYKNIRSHKGIPFVDGDVYYCNWPQIVTKIGNKKMFLTTKWASPHEQTWMSYIFQETKAGKIHPGLLLLTPTEHNRYEHYDGNLRKES